MRPVYLFDCPCSCSQQCRRGPRACQAPRSLDLPRDWEFWKMAKSGMLSLESLPLHHAGNLPRALIFPVKCFRFTHFRKNASATPLVSHTFKTKDLKPFRFTYFQKKGGGRVPLSNIQPQTDHPTRMVVPSERSESRDLPSNLCSSLNPFASTLTKNASASPLDSALTSKRASKSFTSNTYEKRTQGGGGAHPLSTLNCRLSTMRRTGVTCHESRVTSHESRVTNHFPALRRPDRSAIIVCSAKGNL